MVASAATERVEETPFSLWLCSPSARCLVSHSAFGAYNYVFFLLLTWLPRYLSSALDIDLLHSFLYTSVPWIIATITDIAVGGWLVDFLVQRGWNASGVRRAVLIGGTAFGLGILGAAHARNAMQALIWISISIGGLPLRRRSPGRFPR